MCIHLTGGPDATDPVLPQISENPFSASFQAVANPEWTHQHSSCDGGGQETQNNVLNDRRSKPGLHQSSRVKKKTLLQDGDKKIKSVFEIKNTNAEKGKRKKMRKEPFAINLVVYRVRMAVYNFRIV